MVGTESKHVEYLVVDTSAFIQNAPLQNLSSNLITCKEVVNEITNKRQLRRLVTLPYDLQLKDVFPEFIQIVTEFSKKTGDYPSLSATDIKVMALTYQLEKEHVGVDHLRMQPIVNRSVSVTSGKPLESSADVSGFYVPKNVNKVEADEEIKTRSLSECSAESDDSFYSVNEEVFEDAKDSAEHILAPVEEYYSNGDESQSSDEEEDEEGWITPANLAEAKKHVNSDLIEEKCVKVACVTSDFAMQNVLKQMNLNVATLDGKMIRQLRTFILRCYGCFKTTSIMTKQFCPNCGNNTLKRVAVSLDENGKQVIHINAKKSLTRRGKKFSLPTPRGGKHSNYPILSEDQPVPDQRPTRLARTKTNPLDDDYIAGYSPFIMRDVTSKSAQLKIRPNAQVKHWMQKNPNESRRRRNK